MTPFCIISPIILITPYPFRFAMHQNLSRETSTGWSMMTHHYLHGVNAYTPKLHCCKRKSTMSTQFLWQRKHWTTYITLILRKYTQFSLRLLPFTELHFYFIITEMRHNIFSSQYYLHAFRRFKHVATKYTALPRVTPDRITSNIIYVRSPYVSPLPW